MVWMIIWAASGLSWFTLRGPLGPGWTSAAICSVFAALAAAISLAGGQPAGLIFFVPASIFVSRLKAGYDKLLP